MKDDCIFCKLANGVFETNKIYEDTRFLKGCMGEMKTSNATISENKITRYMIC